ncbi:MAG: hypothetical protein AAGK60_13025 [Pseudomonadota bacterium]
MTNSLCCSSRMGLALILLSVTFTGIEPVAAQPGGLVAKLQACKSLQNDGERLACLDRVLAALPGSEGLAREQLVADERAEIANPAPEPMPAPALVTTAEDRFGQADLARRERAEKAPESIEVEVAEILLTRAGRYVVRLKNGQEWRQLKADTKKLRFSDDASGETAILQSKLFGAHSLRLAGSNRSIRVERRK